MKQKDIEIIMQQQQQTIYNLREENHLIKSRLEHIENQLFQSTTNNQESKANNQKSPIYASSIPNVTLPIHNNQLPESNTDSNCNTSNVSFGDKDSPSSVSQSTVVSPKQSSASKLSSVIQRSRHLANKEGTNKGQNAALKSSTPCPFLIRRGRCLKGNRCDFKHPKPSKAPKKYYTMSLSTKKATV